jgi:hypothetical protein
MQERTTQKETQDNKGTRWNSSTDLERGQGNSWKHSLLALLCGALCSQLE